MVSNKDTNKNGIAIVPYGRSIISLMIAHSLGDRGIKIIGCDTTSMTVLSFSNHVKDYEIYADPHKEEKQFIADMKGIIEKYKPEDDSIPYVLIPAFNETTILAKHRKELESLGITLAGPDIESINRISPKDNFARTLQNSKVDSPDCWLPQSKEEVTKLKDEINFPVFIKPPDDVGGRGISKIDKAQDLEKAYDDLVKRYPGEQIIIQQAVTGDDYCFCGLFSNGKLLTSLVYRNLQKFPHESGAGVMRETVNNSQFDDLAEQLMKEIGWSGVVEIDFLWDGKDQSTPQMIEVNPRFWAALDHAITSGVDFPWLLYQLFVDGKKFKKDYKDIEPQIGVRTKLPALSTIANFEELLSDSINFDALKEKWPTIIEELSEKKLKHAFDIFKEGISETFSFDKAYHRFKDLMDKDKTAINIKYGQDDPFVGLGILFVLSYLFRHGTLPPEVKR